MPARDKIFLLFAMVFPTFAASIYFVSYSGEDGMLPAYTISKIIQFGSPLLWVIFVQKENVLRSIRLAPRSGFGLGWATGIAICVVILGGYYAFFRDSPILASAPDALDEKLDGLGMNTLPKFLFLALFVSVIHSLLEEYYWRWFAYRQLRRIWRPVHANWVSSLGFMAHHGIIIDAYVPREHFWTATVFFSLSVALGGAIWAWTYERTKSLYAGWLSHMLVDFAIMWMGYDLVFAAS